MINAIKHGNQHDLTKTVSVEFDMGPTDLPDQLVVLGSRPGRRLRLRTALPDPLAPENLLKSSGRGIFFMRNFMDRRLAGALPTGGMEVRMVKRVSGIA